MTEDWVIERLKKAKEDSQRLQAEWADSNFQLFFEGKVAGLTTAIIYLEAANKGATK